MSMEIINQLFEAVYYGADLEFKYNGYYYFVNSGKTTKDGNGVHQINVSKSEYSFYNGTADGKSVEIFNICNIDSHKNTEDFFNAKIFEGKTLYEAIDNVTEINY